MTGFMNNRFYDFMIETALILNKKFKLSRRKIIIS